MTKMEHYRSLNRCLRERFGEKIYKLALDGGFTCPTLESFITREDTAMIGNLKWNAAQQPV